MPKFIIKVGADILESQAQEIIGFKEDIEQYILIRFIIKINGELEQNKSPTHNITQ